MNFAGVFLRGFSGLFSLEEQEKVNKNIHSNVHIRISVFRCQNPYCKDLPLINKVSQESRCNQVQCGPQCFLTERPKECVGEIGGVVLDKIAPRKAASAA